MKKWTSLLFAGMLVLSMTGCGQPEDRQEDISARDDSVVAKESEQMEAADFESGLSHESEDAAGSNAANVVTPPVSDDNSAAIDRDVPVVYMTTDISPEGLMAVYEALGASPTGQIAIKLSMGESENSNHLRPELIGDLVQSFDNPTIVECNTAYGGNRASTALHKQLAEDHGYTGLAAVDIMDENGSMTLPVSGGDNLTENYVGANFGNYDYFIVLSHFKGHAMAGFGGAIKNISIGIASFEGKAHIHSGGTAAVCGAEIRMHFLNPWRRQASR